MRNYMQINKHGTVTKITVSCTFKDGTHLPIVKDSKVDDGSAKNNH